VINLLIGNSNVSFKSLNISHGNFHIASALLYSHQYFLIRSIVLINESTTDILSLPVIALEDALVIVFFCLTNEFIIFNHSNFE
jgi:N6-adenosine-specific RNA methylase IME4